MPSTKTIPEMILNVCRRSELSSKTALCFATGGVGDESLTYAALGIAIKSVAAKLREMGFDRGDRIALCSENRPLWGAAYLGSLAAGCISVPVDVNLGEHELREILTHSGSVALIYSDKTSLICESAAEALEPGMEMVRIEELDSARGMPSSEPKESAEKDAPVAQVEQGDGSPSAIPEAVVIYTSGTTGRPKGVVLSHANILSNVDSLKKAIHFDTDDVFLSVLPLNHTFECTAGLLAPLSVGATVSYAPSLRPRELRDSMRSARPTIMLGVPLLYQKLLLGFERAIKRSPAPQKVAVRSLMGLSKALARVLGHGSAKVLMRGVRAKAGLDRARLLISGAAPMPVSVGSGFRDLGLILLQGYGLTEASPVVAVNRLGDVKDETVGLALPGVDIAIDSPGEDGVGEILVRGDNVMVGYYRDSEETSKVLQNGWLKTGDLGRTDEAGHLHISGRIKNVIVSSAGKNIYPEELEDILLTSLFIEEVLVVGRSPGEGRGQQAHALVLPDREAAAAHLGVDPGDLSEDALTDLIKGEIRRLNAPLADYKKIRGFSVRDEEFPKTGTKKIRRYLFQDRETPV